MVKLFSARPAFVPSLTLDIGNIISVNNNFIHNNETIAEVKRYYKVKEDLGNGSYNSQLLDIYGKEINGEKYERKFHRISREDKIIDKIYEKERDGKKYDCNLIQTLQFYKELSDGEYEEI